MATSANRRFLAIVAFVIVGGCAGPQSDSVDPPHVRTPKVTQYGGMRAVMREGQTEPRISLADAVSKPHAIAVGALEGLAGEVTIIDGKVLTAKRGASVTEVTVDAAPAAERESATLLTLAYVPAWSEHAIPAAAEGEALDAMIAQIARDAGFDTSKPFPLKITGTCEAIDIHVVHNFCPHGETPGTADALPWHFAASAPLEVTIAGFYAPNAAGVMTHHGTSTHLHAVLDVNGAQVTGHVDALRVAPGMALELPAAQ